MTKSKYLSTSEVASQLGLSANYVAKLVRRGEITPSHQGPGVRGPMFFEKSELEHYQAMRELQAAGKPKK